MKHILFFLINSILHQQIKYVSMGLKEAISRANIQGIIALFVVIFGMAAMVFTKTDAVTKSLIGNFVVVVLAFYFRNSNPAKKNEVNE